MAAITASCTAKNPLDFLQKTAASASSVNLLNGSALKPATEGNNQYAETKDAAADLLTQQQMKPWSSSMGSNEKWLHQNGFSLERNADDRFYQQIAQQIVDKHGWDNSIYDYGIWLRAFGPRKFGLYMLIDKTSNQLVGTASVGLYDEVAHVSMFYIKPEYRGRLIGPKLSSIVLAQAGKRSVYCYGVEEMWAKYANNLGMNNFLDWRLWSMQADCAHVRPELLPKSSDESVELKHWKEVPFKALTAFDRLQTAGVVRDRYLHEALNHPESFAMVAVDTGSKDNNVIGMCQARRLINRRLGISLFYAEKPSVASALLRQVLLEFAGPKPEQRQFTTLLYKTPSTNRASVDLFKQLVQGHVLSRAELVPQFAGPALPFPGHRIYSIGDEHASLI